MTMTQEAAYTWQADLANLRRLIDRVLEPMKCTTPAYGAPGYAHCAACCYNTGWEVTSLEELRMCEALDTARYAIDAVTREDST